jgi:NADH-ubiquinone oxidoreductase chain 4
MFIVHLWFPKVHVEAPVSGSMILANVLLKLGGYGLFRVFQVASGLVLLGFL